ncbi:hypothetical protein [Pseudomonas sp. UMAB-40]|uniref:hypothetical protein n=1 Tax=Pseudomonas sp. UMAB-40 TaxID=1365407 RepID=UPI001C58C6A6|nr:hypothetical protein [Pseudomonas sp. UMAB-40]
MTRLNSTAFSFTAAVFGISISMYAAHAPFSTSLYVCIVITLTFASASSFMFMKSALLYLREGEPELNAKSSQPQEEQGNNLQAGNADQPNEAS